MNTSSVQKTQTRKLLIEVRRTFIQQKKSDVQRSIDANFFVVLSQIPSQTICLYTSLPDEVETSTIISRLILMGNKIVLPKVCEDRLQLFFIDSLNDVQIGSFGILEPKTTCTHAKIEHIEMFVIPGIAFDRSGNRLGWGKGYYDRLLENVQVPIVALAFSCQIMETIPHENHDKKVSNIVTENEIIRIRRSHAKKS